MRTARLRLRERVLELVANSVYKSRAGVLQTPFRIKIEMFNDTTHLGMQLLSEFAQGNLGAKL